MNIESIKKLVEAAEKILQNPAELKVTEERSSTWHCKIVHYQPRTLIIIRSLLGYIKPFLDLREEEIINFLTIPDMHSAQKSDEQILDEFKEWLKKIINEAKKLID